MKKYYFILFSIFFLLFSGTVSASSLYTVSANQTVEVGQSFEVDWYLNTGNISINTLDLKLHFTQDTLEVVEAGPGNSLFNLWIAPPAFDNGQGTLSLTGGITNGVKGSDVPVLRSVFRAKKEGRGEITMDPESQNLKNDGEGNPEALTFTALSFPIVASGSLPVKIVSDSHPDQNAWYKDRNVRIHFETEPTESYSYSFSANPDIYPDNQPSQVPETIEYKDLPDGIYYFKVNSKITDEAWQEAGLYRIQIDGTAPEPFQPIVGKDASIRGGREFLSFSTLDKTSGISHYDAREGWFGVFRPTSSPKQLDRMFLGDRIVIRAFDKAGNYREIPVEYSGYLNKRNAIPVAAGVVVLMLLLWFILRRNKSNKQSGNQNI